jgi:nitrogen fixation NifU-like protein
MLRFFLSPLATASVSAARGASQRAGAAALSLGQCVSPPDTPHRASFCARRPPATLPAPPLFLPRRFSRGYHANVLDHYENPRNVGSLDKNADDVGTGLVGAPACGDVMKLQLRINDDGIIEDAKFKTFGCGSAIASSSLVTEMVKGKSIEFAMGIENSFIAEELKLPPVKIHCSVLAEDAIKAAIADYQKKKAAKEGVEAAK